MSTTPVGGPRTPTTTATTPTPTVSNTTTTTTPSTTASEAATTATTAKNVDGVDAPRRAWNPVLSLLNRFGTVAPMSDAQRAGDLAYRAERSADLEAAMPKLVASTAPFHTLIQEAHRTLNVDKKFSTVVRLSSIILRNNLENEGHFRTGPNRAGPFVAPSSKDVEPLMKAFWLSLREHWALWLCGQVILGVSFVQFFVALHEAGHGVLFRTQRLNVLVGHVAGFITLIPFGAWQPIHQKHHIWAGWQDRDPTTMALVPRTLSRFERTAINMAWRTGLPLFSLLYRVNNFWNIARLLQLLPQRRVQERMLRSAASMVLFWVAVVVVAGPIAVVQVCGLSMVLGFMLQEPIMLSQHTHIPLQLAGDREVAPFSPAAQLPFTRSLRFPSFISRYVLLHFDAHELHHEHPNIPGWRLRAIDRPTPNDMPAFAWIKKARAIPADVFMFQNRNTSGLDV